MGIILFIVAVILVTILTALSFVFTPIYYLVTFKWKTGIKEFDRWFYKMALSLDQFGALACSKLLKVTLTKGENAHPFTDEDDTASYVIGRNKYRGTLTRFGRWIDYILNILDKEHTDKAIKMKMKSDLKAYSRLKRNQYYK